MTSLSLTPLPVGGLSLSVGPAYVDTDGSLVDLIGVRVGNDALSDYGPNTGTPAGNQIPIKFQVLKGTPGVDLTQTQQGGVGWTKYRTRCVDDASESWSFGVIANDAWGAWPGAQTQPVTGLEGDALLQGAVVVNGKTVAVVGGVQIQNTAHSDDAISFYSAQTNVVGTVTNRYGFFDEGTTGAGTITNNWSFYGRKRIQSEDSVVIGSVGANATSSRLFIVGAASSGAATVAIAAGGSQTGNLQEWRNSSNSPIAFIQVGGAMMLASAVISNAKLGITTSADVNSGIIIKASNSTQSADLIQHQDNNGNPLFAITASGAPKWSASALAQTTVGAAGGASALPATPTKYLKVKDSAGTILVIPAYAAS